MPTTDEAATPSLALIDHGESVISKSDHDGEDHEEDPAEKNKKGKGGISSIINWTMIQLMTLTRQTIALKKKKTESGLISSSFFWISFSLFCWYFPRYLIHNDTKIINKRPPYQTIDTSGTVIVDFELNHPLVDPPTVDNLVLRSTGLFLPLIFLVLHAWCTESSSSSSSSSSNNKINNNDTMEATDTMIPEGRYNNKRYENDATSSSVSQKTYQRNHRIASVISSFCAAIGLSEGCTVMIKLWVQRRRPNFYDLCGFDPNTKKCMATIERIHEANFSFPSGHSSLICCGMTFLVWYLHGTSSTCTSHNRLFRGSNTHNQRLTNNNRLRPFFCFTCVPLIWTLFVAASRLVDNWHHPSDVVAGLLLGFVSSTIAYHNWYPTIWSSNAGIPRSLLLTTTTTNNKNDDNDDDHEMGYT